jgi:hypothetical protein
MGGVSRDHKHINVISADNDADKSI